MFFMLKVSPGSGSRLHGSALV